MLDAVKERVAEHHVGVGHVYLGTEHLFAVGVLAVAHLPEELEVLFYAAVAVGRLGSGSIDGTASGADLFLGLVIDVCKAPLDEVFRPLVKLVEIVRCVELLVPLEAKPLYIFFD